MRTQINLYMVVFVTAIISTGLIAQDSIEEITVTSSYVSHSDDQANDPIHIPVSYTHLTLPTTPYV